MQHWWQPGLHTSHAPERAVADASASSMMGKSGEEGIGHGWRRSLSQGYYYWLIATNFDRL